MGIKTRIRPVILIMLVTVVSLALLTGYVLLWRLSVLAAALTLFGYIWVRVGLSGVDVRADRLQEECQAGEVLEAVAVVHNNSPLPKFMIKISQKGALPGYANRLALNLPARGSYRWHTRVECARRGRYSLAPLAIEVTDPFGIFSGRKNAGTSQSVLVYPAVKELELTPLLSYDETYLTHNRWQMGRSGGEISRVREYANGDSMNHIHWRSTAHTGQLMVKDFNQDRTRNIWVVLDMMKGAGGKGVENVERRVTAAASLAKYYIERGYPVGLITEGDSAHVFLPRPGEKHYWCMMEALATLKAEGRAPVDALIERERNRFKSGSLVLVVTAAATDRLLAGMQQLNNKGASALLAIPGEAPGTGSPDYKDLCRSLTASSVPAYVVG